MVLLAGFTGTVIAAVVGLVPTIAPPASAPVRCSTAPTVVTDPVGDVLSYQMGSAPAPTGRTGLSGIDIVKAAVQIDGGRICATFTFAAAPGAVDMELKLNLEDTEHWSCCATLLFRRRAGRVELGSFSIGTNGYYNLRPVADAGALLKGNVLRISGTVPRPSQWAGMRARKMPVLRDLAWSVTTSYFSHRSGPYFGDWLPRFRSVGRPMIRQRDGATVAPSATP